MSCCLLKALKNRLLTRSRLLQFGIISSALYVLCNSNIESMEHLFFSCPFSAYIWTICKLRLELSNTVHSLHEEATLLKAKFFQKKKISALDFVVLAAMYGTYGERGKGEYLKTKHILN